MKKYDVRCDKVCAFEVYDVGTNKKIDMVFGSNFDAAYDFAAALNLGAESKEKQNKNPNFFIQNVDSGEPAFHCGSGAKDALKGMSYLIESEIQDLQDSEEITFVVSRKDMTDEEVEQIPEY